MVSRGRRYDNSKYYVEQHVGEEVNKDVGKVVLGMYGVLKLDSCIVCWAFEEVMVGIEMLVFW